MKHIYIKVNTRSTSGTGFGSVVLFLSGYATRFDIITLVYLEI